LIIKVIITTQKLLNKHDIVVTHRQISKRTDLSFAQELVDILQQETYTKITNLFGDPVR